MSETWPSGAANAGRREFHLEFNPGGPHEKPERGGDKNSLNGSSPHYAPRGQLKCHYLPYWRQPRVLKRLFPPKKETGFPFTFTQNSGDTSHAHSRSENGSENGENVTIPTWGRTPITEQGETAPVGRGAIYSGDDTGMDDTKEALEEAWGDDVERQVAHLMQEPLLRKKELKAARGSRLLQRSERCSAAGRRRRESRDPRNWSLV